MAQRSTPNSDPSSSVSPATETDLSRIIAEQGLASRQEIEFCKEQQKQSSDPNARSLADLLIENGFITANQAKRVKRTLEERRSSQIPGYTLLGKLGKGAMATVYKGRQISLDRIVAIKVLSK